jgi:ubiquinone/menaquinone biosynthesis C-methylase UbiE
MPPTASIYDSSRLALGYAYHRPLVHPHVMRMVATHLWIATPAGRALDVGCGAGRSTEALGPLATTVVGLEPVPAMLAHCCAVAPGAHFVVGRAEELPFPDHAFDLITAAGSLNYVDLGRFLPDAARVLTPAGTLVIYDFSAGRRFRQDPALDEWYQAFEIRYPGQPGYALDARTMDYERFGLQLDAYHEFEVALPLTAPSYLEYVLTQTNVERAIARGVPEDGIRDWCRSTIAAVFGPAARDVLFRGYVAYVKR